MNRQLPQLIIMISGALLIVVGIVLVAIQMGDMTLADAPRRTRSIETTPSGGIKLTTTYVGLVVMVIGAALEIVGYLGATPWRRGGGGGPGDGPGR